jgi:hypothetical protein
MRSGSDQSGDELENVSLQSRSKSRRTPTNSVGEEEDSNDFDGAIPNQEKRKPAKG